MKPIKRLFYLLFALCNFTALAVEYHVSPNGNDAAKGFADYFGNCAPTATISAEFSSEEAPAVNVEFKALGDKQIIGK